MPSTWPKKVRRQEAARGVWEFVKGSVGSWMKELFVASSPGLTSLLGIGSVEEGCSEGEECTFQSRMVESRAPVSM